MLYKSLFPITLFLFVGIIGCSGASYHRGQVQADSDERITVGKVQKEIRVGMSGAEVATVLGSPNIVTTDENRREVWVYDRIATQTAYSTENGGVSTLILGGAPVGSGLLGGGGGAGYNRSAGAAETSQRTLTVVIKYDRDGKVRDFAYHTSRF